MNKKKNKQIQKGNGLTGLVNLGNTCFLNSCMQALSHTYELNTLLNMDKIQNSLSNVSDKNNLIIEWKNLNSVMWTKDGIVSPNRFVYNVQQVADTTGRDIFTGWAQNDLPEFLRFFIECMHSIISRPVNMTINGNIQNKTDKIAVSCYEMLDKIYSNEYSEIMEMFYGIYVSELSSKTGSTIHSVNPENYFILDLEIPKQNASLYECFDAFTAYEMLEGDNAWYNENTKMKEDVRKRITFWNLPKILIIAFKRFDADGDRKKQDLIQFPLTNLNLSKYVSGYNSKQYIYDLYAVCNHSGGTMGGHYTSYVKTISNEWVHFNDTQVERFIPDKKIVSSKAYCLFYRKR
jgi:ubiquitin C-terminal hydrolase